MSTSTLLGQSGISMPSGQIIGANSKGDASNGVQEFHKKRIEDIIRLFDSNLDFGLTDDKVNLAKRKYHITKDDEDETSFVEQIKEQFEDRTVRLLLAAALVSFLTNFFSQDGQDELPAWVEPCVIIAILVCNGMVAIYQDRKADEATKELEGLKQMRVLVKRNGLWTNVPSHELVPGDIVQLRQGAKVYADCRLVQMQSIVITVNEINLTGQKKEVQKCITENEKVESELQSLNMLFAGSIVRMGRAVAIVCRTGHTCIINSQKKGADEAEDSTLLEQKLDAFGKFLEIAVFYICIFIWVMNFTNFREPLLGGFIKGCLYYFKIAVSLAVAALPEGLPTVITACLALGTRRLTERKAIIKKLSSVETLGTTTIVCTSTAGLTVGSPGVAEFRLFGSDAGKGLTRVTINQHTGEFANLKECVIENLNIKQFVQGLFVNNINGWCQGESFDETDKSVPDASFESAMYPLSKRENTLSPHDSITPRLIDCVSWVRRPQAGDFCTLHLLQNPLIGYLDPPRIYYLDHPDY